MSDNDVAKKILKRFQTISQKRTTWENHWQEIAERVWPDLSGTFQVGGTGQQPGEKRTQKLFDATAPVALTRFAAAMESMLTPRNNRWHKLTTTNKDLNKLRHVRLWFDEVTEILFRLRYSPEANFASQAHAIWMMLGAFGTGAMFIDERKGGGIRYRAEHLSDTYLVENHEGMIDTLYRKFDYTAQQALNMWGAKKLPDFVLKAAENDPDKTFRFIHLVKPREDIDPTRMDYRGMPFASYYVLDERGGMLISEGGYHTFPYPVSRYLIAPKEAYGRSPAMLALPSIKTINEQSKTILKQGQRIVDPVLLAHDDGIADNFSMRSGALNPGTVDAQGRPLIHTLPTGNLSVGYQMMEQERQIINDVFLVTLFQILTESPQMTATEVLERVREKGALLSPTMGRQQSEFLGPMISREIDIAARQRLLPEMPGELKEAQGEYDIEYDSPLSRAQKTEEATGLLRYIESSTTFFQATNDPSPFDYIDPDVAFPELMAIHGIPERWRRGEKEIAAVREARSGAQQDQQGIDALPALAGVMKAASNAPKQ